ncbi:MAG: hypothetical protein WAM97_17845 [Acidimicrobiales bacterium]
MRGSRITASLARSVRPALIVGVAAGLAAVLVGGCSSGESTPERSTSVTRSSTPVTRPFTSVTLKPGTLVQFNVTKNARADVHQGACHVASGHWQMNGTVRNSSSGTKGFQIIVDFVTAKGDTIVSTAEISIASLAPNASATWAATGPKGNSDVACVMRQAQTT